MAYIDPNQAYPDEARYWRMVEDTITDVFLRKPEEAARLVQEYVRRLADASPLARLLGFHDEPFNVASILLHRDGHGSESEHRRYHSLRERNGWTFEATAALNRAASSGGRHAA